jgi:hypothetical protein
MHWTFQKPLTTLTLEVPDEKETSTTYDRAFRIQFPAKELFPQHCHNGSGDGRKSRKLKFRLYYEPELPAMHYAGTFLFWAGDIPIRIDCSGLSDGPAVCFSENLINFGAQYYRDETRVSIKMRNQSTCEAKFQFDTDNLRSPFKVTIISWILT